MGWTNQVCRFVTSLKYEDLPVEVVNISKRAMIDTFACMIAGSKEEVTQVIIELINRYHHDYPISTVLTKTRMGPVHAAFINGIMAHAIDYDDVHDSTHGHPSTVVLPAALAVAELAEATGKELLVAYVVGVEIMAALGNVLGFDHYKKGWHSTSTLGTLGAVAASARVLELNAQQTAFAISIATSQIAGTRQNFGTMMKPYHAGNAARIGVWSALLAKNGISAYEDILESPMGYFHLYQEGELHQDQADQVFLSLGKRFRLLEPGIDVKKYPCCYWTARAADGTLDIANNESFSLESVERIEVITPAGGLAALIYDRPQSGLEGKFSMEYVVSAALLDKKLNLGSFKEDRVSREEILRLEEKVVKWEDSSQLVPGLKAGYVTVRVILSNGVVLERIVHKPRGCSDHPLTLGELKEKMDDCLLYAHENRYDSITIIDQILNVDTVENTRLWMEKFL